jgi:cation diffusion facilitator family transporter
METDAKQHDSSSGAMRAVTAAFFGNLGVAVAKAVAFFMTGSSALLAEAYHSFADTINQVFLFVGLRLEKRPPDEKHPFGYGREQYFWAFIVAVSIFTLGGVLSIKAGIPKIQDPTRIPEEPIWSFAALGIAAIFESYALRIAWKEMQHWRARNPGSLLSGLLQSKAPTILIVLFEDSAALLGIVVAAVGVALSILTGSAIYDGLASIVIGVILLGVAIFIGLRIRGLLLGEAATKSDRDRIKKAVEGVPQVAALLDMLTLHLGPEDILVNLNVNFQDGLDTDSLEGVIDEIESRIRESVPSAKRIFIEAESIRGLSG